MSRKDLGEDVLFAFLRAVNLGRVNKVPMAALVERLEERGLPPAAYLLASGNLAFAAQADRAEEVREGLKLTVAEEFGVRTAVVCRTPERLAELLAEDPFTPAGFAPVYVSLWDDEPDPAGLEALAAEDFSPDALRLVEGAAIMGYTVTSHDSRLSHAMIEKRLKVSATARNVNTLRRLLERFAPATRS